MAKNTLGNITLHTTWYPTFTWEIGDIYITAQLSKIRLQETEKRNDQSRFKCLWLKVVDLHLFCTNKFKQ